MARLLLVLTVASMALVARSARADAVEPPPTNCPDGTVGGSSHSGPYCALDSCSTDTDCASGEVCQPTSLCIGTMGCGGLQFDSGPYPDGGHEPPCMLTTANASCGTAACASGTCMERSVCVSVTAVEPVSRSGCGCHAGTASGDTAAWLLALGTLGLFAARRARR